MGLIGLMKKQTIIIVAIVVVIIAVAIIFLKTNKNSPSNEEEANINEYQQVSDSIQNTYTLTPSKEDEKNNVFVDSQYGFSFQYPKSFTATKFSDQEQTSTILVQEEGGKNGFQIFISWFDEPGPITKERVLQDLPDMKITNAENRILKNGVPALLFFSSEASLGETREIWFINGGYLYQITATKEIDSLVAQIVGTWKFE